ncbi:hypothetical protein [Endozoicomonas acroporae]|uniref:hypothetical protein n=1 Tax=Endozoicomonas acroporae TaxID=1701104 RepID=UPI003D7A1B5C
MIGDLNHGGGNISVGAGWVLRGISNKRDDFRDALLEFEVPVNSGSGRIDIKVTDADDYTTFYEFKTIGKLPPGDFVKQFTRDLVNGDVSSLDQIRWHFEGKTLGKKVFTGEDKRKLLEELGKIEFDDKAKGRNFYKKAWS